jgi:sec-independent protein translocase protein TatA
MAGIGMGELMIILVIVVLVFGVGKLGNVGKELGAGIRAFKDEMSGTPKQVDTTEVEKQIPAVAQTSVPLDVTAESKKQA